MGWGDEFTPPANYGLPLQWNGAVSVTGHRFTKRRIQYSDLEIVWAMLLPLVPGSKHSVVPQAVPDKTSALQCATPPT
eukprot:1462780-Rhodomonas_salina.1